MLVVRLTIFEQSCRACHRESADWLKARVHKIQDNTKMQMDRGGQVVEETIANLKVAKDLPNVDKKMLEEAQRLHRLGTVLPRLSNGHQ